MGLGGLVQAGDAVKRKTNEDNLRAARARLRAARTLLKQAATLLRQSADRECMSETTREFVRQSAKQCDQWDFELTYESNRHRALIAEAEAHLAAKVASRKRVVT